MEKVRTKDFIQQDVGGARVEHASRRAHVVERLDACTLYDTWIPTLLSGLLV